MSEVRPQNKSLISKKCNLHLSLRSSIAPSSGRSHLSHRNVCTSDCTSVSPSLATLRTSTIAQCQARFGKLGWISRRSRIISRRPSVELDPSRTWHVCIDQVKCLKNQYSAVGAAFAVALLALSWVSFWQSSQATCCFFKGYKCTEHRLFNDWWHV